VRAAATQQELSLSLEAELSASQREFVQVSGARDILADEKHQSMSAAAAQHGAVAEALSKELDEARVRLRLTRRFGACLLFVKIRSGQSFSRDSSPCTNIRILGGSFIVLFYSR